MAPNSRQSVMYASVKWVIIGSGNGLSTGRCQAITINQCWFIVDWTPRNTFQWNVIKNTDISHVICKMVFILFRPQCVNSLWLNSLRPRQNGRYFADDTFKRILLNENVRIWIKNSLKFVPKGPINNIPALVQIMAWRRPGDKPLSEPMIVSLSTHVCVTRPQWVNNLGQNCFRQRLFGIMRLKITLWCIFIKHITVWWTYHYPRFEEETLIYMRKNHCYTTKYGDLSISWYHFPNILTTETNNSPGWDIGCFCQFN